MIHSCVDSSFISGVLADFWTSFIESYAFIIFFIAILLCSIVSYCLKSFGMYKIAKNRSFSNAYLSWFPFARYYLFGKISDDINKHKNVKSSHKGILLTLSVLNGVSSSILFGFLFVSIAELLGTAANTHTLYYEYWTHFVTNKINSFLIVITIIFVVSLLFNIFYCIYAHNIFQDYVPKISGLLCVVIVLNLFLFKDSLIDSTIFLSISTNEPESLKNNNQIIY